MRSIKLYTVLSFMLLLLATLVGCREKPNEKIIDIQDYRNMDLPSHDPAVHNNRDVEVYRILDTANAYEFVYYHSYSGELESHGATFFGEKDYKTASYYWKDDTTLAIALIEDVTGNREHFILFGNGGMNGMRIPD